MHGVYFHKSRQFQRTEITIEPVCKSSPVCDLGFVTLSGFETGFAFQINISGGKDALIKIGIHGTDRHIKFRMIGQDMIGGLPLLNERGDPPIFLMELLSGKVDASSGITKFFPVLSVRKPGIVRVFVGNGAEVNFFVTAIADKRSPFQPFTEFFLKCLTGLVTGGAGGTFHTAEDDLAAGIGLFTMIAVDAEILSIIKGAFMIPVREAVSLNLFGDGGRVLA